MSNRFFVDLVILCDDVREEITGKHTLVGVYNDSILVATSAETIAIPLAFFIRGRLKNADALSIELWIEDPEGKRTEKSTSSELLPPPGTKKTSAPSIIEWKVVPWRASTRGTYKLHLTQNGADSVILEFELGNQRS